MELLSTLSRKVLSSVQDVWNLRHSPFIQNLTFLGSSATVAQFIMMLYGILIARFLGPEKNGLYTASYSIVVLTSIFVNFGMDTWMLRSVKRDKNVRVVGGLILSNKLIIGSVWIVSLALIAPGLRPDIYSWVLLILCCVDVLADMLFTTATNALNIDKKLREISWMMLLSRAGRLLSLLVFIGLNETNLVLLTAGRTLATLAGLIWALYVLRPVLSRRLTQMFSAGFEIWRTSFVYAISEFLNIIYQNIDITMVALMADTKSTGLYAPVSGLVHALFILPFSVSVSIIPVLSRIVETDRNRFFREFWRSTIGLAGLGSLLWIVVGLGGNLLIPLLLGNAYQAAGSILIILSPILLIKCIEVACSSLLVAVGWQPKRIGPQFIAAISNVLMNLWAIPNMGIRGVSWAYLISEILLMLGYIYYTFLWIKMNPKS